MSDRKYTPEEIRALIDAFDHPMAAARGSCILMANAAYCRMMGLPREQVEGREYMELLSPEERERIAELSARREQGEWLPSGNLYARGLDGSGRPVTYQVHTQRFFATEGEDFGVFSQFQLPEQASLDFAEVLVEASTAVVSERTCDGVERAALKTLERHGLHGAFFSRAGQTFRPSEGSPGVPDFRDEYAAAALREGCPIFGGRPEWLASQVYLPVRGVAFEPRVLALWGTSFDSKLSASLNLFSQLLSAALLNATQHDDSNRRLLESRLLLDLARTTAGSLELSTVLDVACDFLVRLLDVTNCFILLYDAKGRVLRGSAASAQHRDYFRTVVMSLDDEHSVAARVARERRPVTVGPESIARQGRTDLAERFGETAVVGLPLVARDELLGVIILDETRGPRQFSRQWIELAEATVAQLSLSVANARLYESLRQSYAELDQTRAEMVRRERLAALGELSAVVAHEVRNPLAVIFNAVSSLRRTVTGTGEQGRLLNMLAEESDRLNRIVNDLLDFARPGELHLEPQDVGEVIQESVGVAALYPIGDARVTFETQVEPGLPHVRLDRRRMRQALVNVAVNAMQAMPRGGTVRVKAGREQVGGAEQVRIDLIDDGPGIPADIESRIFEPFFTTKAQGTGLGLAVVKRILEDHRGEVQVRSQQGQGTTFTFRLPLRSESATP